jgi:hypothetical protein
MVERFDGRISELCQQTRFRNTAELEQTSMDYLHTYNHFIPQRTIGYQSPVDALKSWQTEHPELFVKQVYKCPISFRCVPNPVLACKIPKRIH